MMGTFYTDVICKDPRFHATTVCKDLALLEPGTRAAVIAILADAKSQGLDFRVLETYRSPARQHMLFTQRLTELSKVGTHGYGLAADIAIFKDGKYLQSEADYAPLWPLAKKHGMISGDNWGHMDPPKGFRDPDHVQRCPVWRQSELFAGTWYPPETGYDPYGDVQDGK